MSDEKAVPVVEIAKKVEKRKLGEDNIIMLPVGGRARLVPVSATLIGEVSNLIKDPDPPMWFDENKDREVSNPSDPAYLRALEDKQKERGMASLDALIMFGVELLDGMPEDDKWLQKLKFLEKRGQLKLENYDFDDPLDLEFLYKRYIAVPVSIATKVSEISGVSPEEIEAAEASFPGDEER